MRYLTLTLCFLFVSGTLNAQELPKVIPPSPEAISMIQYGNTTVNFYAGQPSLSIPIHTVSSRGYQLPISLSYTAFSGVNVESIAPWVGLGWALNATGTVSRTVRDVPDDINSSKGVGYMTVAEPDFTDNIAMQGYLDGYKDKEPDKFNYSVNGLSGSFFIDKTGMVIQKNKTNVKIEYTRTSEIDNFTITDVSGMQYHFSHKEMTLALGQGQVAVDVPVATSSWYLDSVKDQNGHVLVSFLYYDFSNLQHTTYSSQSLKEDLTLFQAATDMRYTQNTTTAKRIKEIHYSGGKVKFIASSGTRLDYTNDKYLEEIQILDGSDNPIKRFKLSYSYFDENGIVPITSTSGTTIFNGLSVGHYFKRLKLDQVQEWNEDATDSLPPYTFEYNSGNLPHRYSFAKDHWGFYNGQELNNSPEPNYKILYYTKDVLGQPDVEHLRSIGTANKEANAAYSKYGVLKKIIYPSGGSTEFDLEGNTVESDDLPNNKTPQTFDLNIDNVQSSNFNVSLMADPFTVLKLTGTIPHQGCGISGAIHDAGTSAVVENFNVPFDGSGGPFSHEHSVSLKDGTYFLKLQYQSGCTYDDARDKLSMSYENELATTNKPVGGLRVKSITDHDGISTDNDVTRYFYYQENGATGNSTGRLVSVPRYAYQRMNYAYANGTWTSIPHPFGVIRSIRPHYPLMTTNGSYVGYGKVTVINGDSQITGKTEYEFTTAQEYPDFSDGFYNTALSGENYYITAHGLHEVYPFPETEDRDYMRGLQKRQTVYKYNGSTYDKVSEVENLYALTFNVPMEDGGTLYPGQLPDDVSANGSNYSSLKGLKVYVKGPLNYDIKWYNIYTGRLDQRRTTTRQYSATNPSEYIETISTNHWDDLGTSPGYYNVSRVETTDSEGNTLETKMYYPYDLNELSGLSTPETNALVEMQRDTTNMVSTVVQQEQYRAGVKLSTLRNNLELTNSYILPSSVETAKGTNALETRVKYHLYDDFGNPLEVSQEDGTHITYVWGYNKTLPVAKLQNATYAQVETALGTNFDLGTNGLTTTQADSLRAISGALVTTIEYQWGLGMTSQTDPNGLTTSYEYDKFGRLIVVKDPDGNIINTYKYNYKGQ